jgi:hypothetical protein
MMELQAHKVQQVYKEILVHKVQPEMTELLVLLVLKVHRDHKVLKDQLEMMVPQAHKVLLVMMG